VFRPSSLGLTKGEFGILVVEGTPAVNGGTKVPISGWVIGEDVETLVKIVLVKTTVKRINWHEP